MEIKNLAQLKKAVKEKKCFTIVKHHIRPEYDGQKRQPNVVQTNGFYSIVPGDLENKVSLANYGKGSWCEFGKAADWIFEDGLCKFMYRGKPVWEIQFE